MSSITTLSPASNPTQAGADAVVASTGSSDPPVARFCSTTTAFTIDAAPTTAAVMPADAAPVTAGHSDGAAIRVRCVPYSVLYCIRSCRGPLAGSMTHRPHRDGPSDHACDGFSSAASRPHHRSSCVWRTAYRVRHGRERAGTADCGNDGWSR